MADLPEAPGWESGIKQLEKDDVAEGGLGGMANVQASQLANRTQYLRVKSQSALDIAMTATGTYDSKDQAQKAINDGIETRRFFSVKGSGDAWTSRYENVNGVATFTGEFLASGQAVMDVIGKFSTSETTVDFAVVDDHGRPTWHIINGELTTRLFRIIHVPYSGFYLSDQFGRCVEMARKTNIGNSSSNLQQGLIARLENQANDFRTNVNFRENLAARPISNFNHIIFYGQSLSNGTEAWPRLSIIQRYDNLMYGDSLMPLMPNTPEFSPRGGANLKPLIATVESQQGVSLTDEQVALLSPGTIAFGETSCEGMLNSWRRRHLDRLGLVANPNRLFVGSVAGVGARGIEQLSKGANPNLYNRIIMAMDGVKVIADTQSKTYQIGAIVHMQGEDDYPRMTKEKFKELTHKLREDIYADYALKTNATRMPAFFTYQTSGSYTVDTYDMSVGMAQLEAALEYDNWYMIGPSYPYTNKVSGHFDSNGQRNFGEKAGEIAFRVCELGMDWKPLMPLSAVYQDTDVFINFHTPSPPLQFDKPYVINEATEVLNMGFTVIDRHISSDTVMGIESVEIVSSSVIHIKLSSTTSGEVIIRYADKMHSGGAGMLCDSSSAISDSKYEYIPNSGMYPSANILELVGRHYDLRNWCVAFQILAIRS